MSSPNRPCQNPSLCGVQSHRPGTVAACESAGQGSGAGNRLVSSNSPSPIGASHAEFDPRSGSTEERVRAAQDIVFSGGTLEVELRPEAGVRRFLVVNAEGDEDGFQSTDNSVSAYVRLSDGEAVYAADYGSKRRMTLSDGVEITSWVHPESESGDDMSIRMSSAEFAELEKLNTKAHDLGYSEIIDPTGELNGKALDTKAIRNVLEVVDREATDFR